MFFSKKEVKLEKIPVHLAIIMDGNGRWAKARMLSRAMGHKAGAETLRKISKEAERLGIKHLTVYAFSTENWRRSPEEVSALMSLLNEYLQEFINDNDKYNTRVDVIGDISRLDGNIQSKIYKLTDISKNKTGTYLHLALNYGGRDDIVRAVKNVCKDTLSGTITYTALTEEVFDGYLDTKDTPAPDLLIRTSGEQRLSNFLLWQLAYTELYITDTLWPDFNEKELYNALLDYQSRDRRYGSRR